MSNNKRLIDFFLSEKERRLLKSLSLFFGLCILISFFLNTLYSLNILPSFFDNIINYIDYPYPVFSIMLSFYLGIPMFNLLQIFVNSYEKGKALTYILLSLSVFIILCFLLEHFANQLFPVFYKVLFATTVFTLACFLSYEAIKDRLNT